MPLTRPRCISIAKTCLVLVFGFVIFGYTISVKNLFGIAVAVCGLMFYSYIKIQEATIRSMSNDATDCGDSKTVTLSRADDLSK